MKRNVLLTLSLLFLSVSSWAKVQEVAGVVDHHHDEVIKELKGVKTHLEEGLVSTAIEQIEGMIQRLENHKNVPHKHYRAFGLVYSLRNLSFRCNTSQILRAQQLAEEHALQECSLHHKYCKVHRSVLTVNGLLGRINGVNYGAGCRVDTVVDGGH